MSRDRKMHDVIDILEYIVNVRRRLYKPASVSHFIWGTYSVIGGLANTIWGFWPIWLIGFVIGGFIETARRTRVKYALIGWLTSAVLIFLGFWSSFETGTVGLSLMGFGLGAFAGFFLPFMLYHRHEGRERVVAPWLGKIIGYLWLVLVISTVINQGVTEMFTNINGIFMWMNMVGTGYLLMGVILNEKFIVSAGILMMGGVVAFKILGLPPASLPIFIGLVVIGVGIYARERHKA